MNKLHREVQTMLHGNNYDEFYRKLEKISELTNPHQRKKESSLDWQKVVDYINRHPPTNLREARKCLLWSHCFNQPLDIDDQLSRLDLEDCELDELLPIYYFSGLTLSKCWTRFQHELDKKLMSLNETGKLLTHEQVNTILDLRYYSLREGNRRFLDNSVIKLIGPSLEAALQQPLERTRASYLVKYVCSIEFEVHMQPKRARNLIRHVNAIVNREKGHLKEFTDTEIHNYVMAATFLNRDCLVTDIVRQVDHSFCESDLSLQHLDFYIKLLNADQKCISEHAKGLFSDETIAKLCLFLTNNFDRLQIGQIHNLLKQFIWYDKILRNTEVPRLVAVYTRKLYRQKNDIYLHGMEYAALNGQNMKDLLVEVLTAEKTMSEHKDMRLAILASYTDRAAFLNFIEDT